MKQSVHVKNPSITIPVNVKVLYHYIKQVTPLSMRPAIDLVLVIVKY